MTGGEIINIVFVRHGISKEYAFYVPEEIKPFISKGDTVLVKTMRGLDIGTTTTGVISGEGALDIAFDKGAYGPVKPVVGFVPKLLRDSIRNELLSEIITRFNKQSIGDELPF